MDGGMVIDDPRAFLAQLYWAAVQRALPLHHMAAFLPPPPKGKTLVLVMSVPPL